MVYMVLSALAKSAILIESRFGLEIISLHAMCWVPASKVTTAIEGCSLMLIYQYLRSVTNKFAYIELNVLARTITAGNLQVSI